MTETRKIGDRGQVTIPKRLRDKENLRSGDELEFKEENGKIVLEKKEALKEELIEGYKAMGEEQTEIAEEMIKSSEEVTERLEKRESE